jgi:hypothetical protein
MSISSSDAKHRAPEVPTMDSDWDIDAELNHEEIQHAIPVCIDHVGPEFHPPFGALANAVCGRLFRWNEGAELCQECQDTMEGPFNCHVCGKDLYA